MGMGVVCEMLYISFMFVIFENLKVKVGQRSFFIRICLHDTFVVILILATRSAQTLEVQERGILDTSGLRNIEDQFYQPFSFIETGN